jgi:hypothetical protein
MNEPPPQPPPPKSARQDWVFATWKKISEFVADVVHLKRSVATLAEQNKRMEDEISRLQRQGDTTGWSTQGAH